MPSTRSYIDRLGPEQLAEFRERVDDELARDARNMAEAAHHTAQLVTLREALKRREAELAERPTPTRRMEIAAGAATASGAGRQVAATARRPRGRGG